MKTLMIMLVVLISFLIQVDGSYYDEGDILGPNMDVVLKPGQVLHECSNKKKYPRGCCNDHKTAVPADLKGLSREQACALKVCYDAAPDYCLDNKDNCGDELVQRYCPYTCKLCKSKASPKQACEKKNPSAPYGCCWNGVLATGPNNQGCMPCMNLKSLRLCRMFKYDAECMSGRSGNTRFLVNNCAKFCGLC